MKDDESEERGERRDGMESRFGSLFKVVRLESSSSFITQIAGDGEERLDDGEIEEDGSELREVVDFQVEWKGDEELDESG